MQVIKCYRKPGPALDMIEEASLEFKVGHGIIGDSNVGSNSPRQVLLAASETYEAHGLRPTALRENLLVNRLDLKWLKSGQVLAVGDKVLLRITIPCEPCVKLNHERKNLCKEIAENRGILGRVLHGGKVQSGAQIAIMQANLPPLPVRTQDRIYELLAKVPPGKVITYSQITIFVGVNKSFIRTIPRIIRSAAPNLPIHRIVSSNCGLILSHVPNQRQLLSEESVQISKQDFVSSEHVWSENPFLSDER